MTTIKSLSDIPAIRAYLTRIGAEPRSLKTAVIKESHGAYWKDVAVIRFTKEGNVSCTVDEFKPTDLETAQILQECATVKWPELKRLSRIIDPPEALRRASQKDIFEFRDLENMLVMVQVRGERNGERSYVPYTYWDDDQWRACEPDGPLPLYNANRLKEAATVFIHEGAKAARYCQWLVDGETSEARKAAAEHPWGQELAGTVHLGWIGGALSPYRTDWTEITQQGVKRAYIVSDNDDAGRAAVPAISQQLRIPTFMIQFTDEFPKSFDLADKFPDKMFSKLGQVTHYVGPTMRDCMHPATWATDLWANPRGKPTPVLRDAFKTMWAYVEESDLFVCTEMPEILRSESILNKMLAPFSHAAETCRLIVKAYRGRSARICYRPDQEGLMVTYRGSSAINLHVKSSIRSTPGDPKPWLDFLEYMFINDDECNEVKRWCATLIAKPSIRIGYGMLLVSERQGIGKTTLGSHILAPLVGPQNVGFPSESDIANSNFNDWMAHKRLVIVNEIYSGNSWKAYHALKSVITDRDVTVNQKYMRQYTTENWCHVLACSNSMRALKMENDDRRWFYPEVTEVPWSQEKFMSFRRWIEGGGLGIIKHWAENYGDYVGPADRAPMTERKKEMIEGSRSEAQREAASLAESASTSESKIALLIKDVVSWVRASVQGRVFDSDYEIRKAMQEQGMKPFEKRIKVNGRTQYAIVNMALWRELAKLPTEAEKIGLLREHIVKPNELIESQM